MLLWLYYVNVGILYRKLQESYQESSKLTGQLQENADTVECLRKQSMYVFIYTYNYVCMYVCMCMHVKCTY